MSDQAEVQKFKNRNNGREKKADFKRSTFQGAQKDLGVFTYQNDRMSAEAFNSAKQSIIDYLNIKNSHAGYAIEHGEHFPFTIPDNIFSTAESRKIGTDQIAKAVVEYHLTELPEAYGVLIGQCDPSLRAALEEIIFSHTAVIK